MQANSFCSMSLSNGEKLYSRLLVREERKNSHQESTSFMPTAIKVRERKKWWDISPRGIKDMSGVREGWGWEGRVGGSHPRQPCKCYEWKWGWLSWLWGGVGGGGADAIDSASAACTRRHHTVTDRQTDLLATWENRKRTPSKLWKHIFSLEIM